MQFIFDRPVKSIKKKATTKAFQELPASISSEDELSYDSDDDPEWRQTPMFKRIKKLKEEANSGLPPKMSDWVDPEKNSTDLKKVVANSFVFFFFIFTN